jgi:hypothetical protein
MSELTIAETEIDSAVDQHLPHRCFSSKRKYRCLLSFLASMYTRVRLPNCKEITLGSLPSLIHSQELSRTSKSASIAGFDSRFLNMFFEIRLQLDSLCISLKFHFPQQLLKILSP